MKKFILLIGIIAILSLAGCVTIMGSPEDRAAEAERAGEYGFAVMHLAQAHYEMNRITLAHFEREVARLTELATPESWMQLEEHLTHVRARVHYLGGESVRKWGAYVWLYWFNHHAGGEYDLLMVERMEGLTYPMTEAVFRHTHGRQYRDIRYMNEGEVIDLMINLYAKFGYERFVKAAGEANLLLHNRIIFSGSRTVAYLEDLSKATRDNIEDVLRWR